MHLESPQNMAAHLDWHSVPYQQIALASNPFMINKMITRLLDKSLKFIIFLPKYMLWVFKRTVSRRRFF